RFTACDKRRLREVLVEGAGDGVESDVAEHIESCESCRRDLELLAGGADWWSDVRSFLSSVNVGSSDAGRPPQGETRRAEGQSNTHESQPFGGCRKQLGFLSPTEATGSLGRFGSYEIT